MTLRLGRVECRNCGCEFFLRFTADRDSFIWSCRCPACGIHMTKTIEAQEYEIKAPSLSEDQEGV